MSMMDVVIHNNIDVHVGILNFVHAHMISLEKLFHHDVSWNNYFYTYLAFALRIISCMKEQPKEIRGYKIN